MRLLYLCCLPIYFLVLFQPFSYFENEFWWKKRIINEKLNAEPLPSGTANGTLSFLPSTELDDLLKGNQLNQFLRWQLGELKQLTRDYPEKKPYQFSTDSVWAFINPDGSDERFKIEIYIRDPLFTIVVSHLVWHDLSKPFTNIVWNSPKRDEIFVAPKASVKVNHVPMMEGLIYTYDFSNSMVSFNFSNFSSQLLEGEVDGFVSYGSIALNHDSKVKLKFKVKPVFASADNYDVLIEQVNLFERLITCKEKK